MKTCPESRLRYPMKGRADWIAWSLQLIAGFVVGAVIGLAVCREGNLRSDEIIGFTLGAGLVVAAVASHYGDELWLGSDSYRVVPPDEFPQSSASRVASLVIGVIGVGLVGFAYLRMVGVLR